MANSLMSIHLMKRSPSFLNHHMLHFCHLLWHAVSFGLGKAFSLGSSCATGTCLSLCQVSKKIWTCVKIVHVKHVSRTQQGKIQEKHCLFFISCEIFSPCCTHTHTQNCMCTWTANSNSLQPIFVSLAFLYYFIPTLPQVATILSSIEICCLGWQNVLQAVMRPEYSGFHFKK